MSETTHLALPLIAAAQAQKHVTHNEALSALDALVQLAVKDMTLTAPPSAPGEGDRHIVASPATGAWAGREGQVAAFFGGGWTFFAPRRGFVALDEAANRLVIFDGASWVDLSASLVLQNLAHVGVNATADATNRLAVRSPAALFAAIDTASGGSGDMRLVVNKEAPAKTGSLMFQSGWSGRAEFGLAGDDATRLKVSADGATWRTAFTVDPAAGTTAFPVGPVTVNDSGASPTPVTGAKLHLAGSGASSILIDAFAGVPQFLGRRSAGTPSSPSALGANTTLYQIGGMGRGATGYAASARVSINLVSAEAWTDTAQGTRISFSTTQTGTTTLVTRLGISDVGDITPGSDNAQNFGSASTRFKEIFCANGTINTSDAREKDWRGTLSDAELRTARRLLREVGVFRWRDSIASKGEGARLHIGVTAQSVAEAFRAEGLEPAAYGLWCEDGLVAVPAEEADAAAVQLSGTRMGVRYDQLLAFLMAALADQIARSPA